MKKFPLFRDSYIKCGQGSRTDSCRGWPWQFGKLNGLDVFFADNDGKVSITVQTIDTDWHRDGLKIIRAARLNMDFHALHVMDFLARNST